MRDEILRRDDELAAWTRDRQGLFPGVDDRVLPHLATLATWAREQRYRAAAIGEFLDSADYYLIATAMGHGHTVVTHERPSDGVKRVKIPEPCIAHGVSFIDPYVMLRRLRARFVIAERAP